MFNIAKFRKIKNDNEVLWLERHNFRLMDCINVNTEKSSQNLYHLKNISHTSAFNMLKEKYNLKTREKGNNKSIKFVEIVVSASPGFFEGKSKDEIVKFFSDNIKVLKNHFFNVPGSLLSAACHFDETTPHAHVVFVPLVKSNGKVKLSAKDIFGGIKKCKHFQTVMNRELNKLGWNFERGIERKKAEVTTLQEFYSNLEYTRKEFETIQNELEDNKKLIDRLIEFICRNGLYRKLEIWLKSEETEKTSKVYTI